MLLKDQKTVLTVTVKDNIVTLNVGFIIKNLGNAQSGLLYFKVYLPEPFNTKSKSADEPMFKYEYHINPEEIHPNVIPGNYISSFHLSIDVGADVLGPELKLIKGDVTFSVWIDSSHHVRKVQETESTGEVTIVIECTYSSFNQPVKIALPPPREVYSPSASVLNE